MIINSISLKPFAGVSNRTTEFKKGLNIVLGPNESGKSTIVNALRSSLFIDTHLTQTKFNSLMKHYLPVSGSDTISVELDFSFEGNNYNLLKSWGATKASRLILPNGAQITRPEEITERISGLLGFNRGTYENVLIIRQALLPETFRSIKEDSETSGSLMQLLRNSSFATGGVSVAKLKDRLDNIIDEYYSRWDTTSEMPEKMKDIDNEWKNNVGHILSAYYSWRRSLRAFRAAEQYELQLDEIIRSIAGVSSEAECHEDYVKRNKPVYESLNKRRALELRKALIEKEISELVEVHRQWPVAEFERESAENQINSVKERITLLEAEKTRAEMAESQRELKERYARLKPLHEELKREEEKLSETLKVTPADIREAEGIRKTYDSLMVKFEAQKLNVSITAKRTSSFRFSEGLNEASGFTLNEGENLKNTVSGTFTFENEEILIKADSGNENIKDLMERLESSKAELEGLLRKFRCRDEAGLKARAEEYRQRADACILIDRQLKRELSGERFEDIESRFLLLETPGTARPFKEVADLLQNEKITLTRLQGTLNEKKRLISQWSGKYQSVENLIDMHVDKKGDLRTLTRELSALEALPESYSDTDEFIRDFEKRQEILGRKKEEYTNLRLKRAELEKLQPEKSLKELEEEVIEALSVFERKKLEGRSYLLIQKELDEILEELDSNTFIPLKEELNGLIKSLTQNRYSSADMNETLPLSLSGTNGPIPLDLLSAGTKDLAALALRLAMARFYLKEREGFIIMDDPLVNLDPGRQRVAVETIKLIASEKQIILMTCHPRHAEMFGIEPVVL